MTATPNVTFNHHTADAVEPLLDDLRDAYADAYGHVPGEDSSTKSAAFRDRATAALAASNYSPVTAHADGQLMVLPLPLTAERR